MGEIKRFQEENMSQIREQDQNEEQLLRDEAQIYLDKVVYL